MKATWDWFNKKEVMAINFVLLGLGLVLRLGFSLQLQISYDKCHFKLHYNTGCNLPRNPQMLLFFSITCLKKPSSPNSAELGPCLPISMSPSSLELWPRGNSKESCENKFQILTFIAFKISFITSRA